MGEKSEDVMSTFNLSVDNAKKYDHVKEKFENHFVKRRNTIFERAKFNTRKQEAGESVDSFVTDLYCLAKHCNYGPLHDEMIRDRIVVGLLDSRLSEKLQMDAELTLEKAVNATRQSELVKKQQSIVRGTEGSAELPKLIGAVNNTKKSSNKFRPENFQSSAQRINKCNRCGKLPNHPRSECPAKDATCLKCKKKGHYKAVCRSFGPNVNALEESDDDETFLGIISTPKSDPWKIPVVINGKKVMFKVDTGADVSVIPDTEAKKLNVEVKETSKVLTGPCKGQLNVCGSFCTQLHTEKKSARQTVYIVKGLKHPLLGRPAIEALNIVSVVQQVQVSTEGLFDKFPQVFEGLGKLDGEYNIDLKEETRPYAVTTPRRVPLPLMDKVREELERMEKQGVITRIDKPTDWCAPMVVVPKQNGKVRICVDFTKLNDCVRRERHILPSVEHILAQVDGGTIFTKLDANSGFYQIQLSKQSAELTTFITPFGRFYFNRLPFGITSAPEHFQKRMSEELSGLKGTLCMIDDILVTGKTQEEHDQRLMATLGRIQEAGITLNRAKCEFSKDKVTYLGQVISSSGIQPDPDKVKAILEMKEPENISEVRQFLGMANQLGKFTSNLSDLTKPLRDLLSHKSSWHWGPAQAKAFTEVKRELSNPNAVLAYYDANRETIVSADASSFGLGAVLLQKQTDTHWRPVAFHSRALTDAEQRYAQIEKEALAATWACERFSDYLVGKVFEIQTDHKPLVPLLGSKDIDSLPPRIQRFRMRLMRFHYRIVHVPGKELSTADALSRAPLMEPSTEDMKLQEDVYLFVNQVVDGLPVTDVRRDEIRKHQEEDEICCQIKQFSQEGWPERVKGRLKLYHPHAGEFTVQNGILLKGCQFVIPLALRGEMLDRIHSGHQGITKCRARARQAVWWPGISREIEEIVRNCATCAKKIQPRSEPMKPSSLPEYPWQRVATDLMQYKGNMYLLVIDYYSRYIEIAKLSTTTSKAIINHLKSIFSRHGIPERLISDNGPQYSSGEFVEFARVYGFDHVTSSPLYPQANGEVEKAVSTAKSLIGKSDDPYLAMLSYRATPLEHGYSPAELLMGRKLRTTLPIARSELKPKLPDWTTFKVKDQDIKDRQTRNFDSRHGVRELPPLSGGDPVWITDQKTEGIVNKETADRSYQVDTSKGTVRRNRKHLVVLPDTPKEETPRASEESQTPPDDTTKVTTRSGREVRPPQRYKD